MFTITGTEREFHMFPGVLQKENASYAYFIVYDCRNCKQPVETRYLVSKMATATEPTPPHNVSRRLGDRNPEVLTKSVEEAIRPLIEQVLRCYTTHSC